MYRIVRPTKRLCDTTIKPSQISIKNIHHSVNSKRYALFINSSCLRNQSDPPNLVTHQVRHASFQESIQSLATTQAGIFKSMSESTPVEYCQKGLLYIHDVSGLPWWATIIVSTILVRSVMTLPLAVYQQIIAARLENLKLEMPGIATELKKEVALAVRMYNWDEKMARASYKRSIRKQWDNLVIRDNCHPFKTTLLFWVQLPLWISISVSLRNLAYMLPVHDAQAELIFTQMALGGFGIIPNLTVPDSSWIFPVALGLINTAIIEMQVLSKNPDIPKSKIQTVVMNMFRVLNVLMIPISAAVPSCLVLYWTTSSSYGLIQNMILLSPKVKRVLGIPHSASQIQEPYKLIVQNLKRKLKLS